MSTISDWLDDYGGADTNIPQSNTAIPFPANTTTDLGFVLRDAKAVIRQESLNKGWEPDSYDVEFRTASTFAINTNTDLTEVYPAGTAVKCNLGNSTVYSWIRAFEVDDDENVFGVSPSVLTNTLVSVTFAAVKPQSSVGRTMVVAGNGYPFGVGSALPQRVTQWGRFWANNFAGPITVPLAREEYDAQYRVLLQAVRRVGSPAAAAAYRVTDITKSTTSITVTFAGDAGDGSTVVHWEYCIVRGT